MLIFTTTEPGFMGSAGSDPFIPRKNPTVVGPWQSVYIHGEAENTAGYDIPRIVEGTLQYKPEQECLLALKDGVIVDCLLIAWWAKCGTLPDPDKEVIRGLICAKTDEESLFYARLCQVGKKSIL